MQKTLRLKSFFAVAVLVLIALSSLTYLRLRSIINSSESIEQSNVTQLEIEKLYSNLKEAEANFRGMIITRDSIFYTSYSRAVNEVDQSLDVVSERLGHSRQQKLSQLRTLIGQRLGLFANYNPADTLGQNPANRLRGKTLMDKIKSLIVEIQKEEQSAISSIIRQRTKNIALTPLITFLLILFSLVILIFAYFRIIKDLRQTRSLQKDLADNNQTLAERNIFIEGLLNSSEDVLLVIDTDKRLLATNSKTLNYIQKEFSEVKGKAITEIFPNIEQENGYNNLERALNGEHVHIKEYETLRGLYWEVSLVPFKTQGHVYAVMLTAHDINSIVETKNRLRALNEQLSFSNEINQHAEQMLQFGSFRADFETRTLYYSENLYRVLGCEPYEFIPSRERFKEFVHPDDLEFLDAAGRDAYNNLINEWNFRMIRKDGQMIYVRSTAKVYTDEDGHRWLTGTLQDVTEEKNRERQLLDATERIKLSELRYQLMVSEIEDYAMMFLDKNGVVQNWNKGVKRIHGYEENEIVGQNFRIFYTKNDKDNDVPGHLLMDAERDGKSSHEGWRVRRNGTVFWGYVVVTALHNSNGEIIGFSKITRDLTERKIADENTRRHAEILEQKNRDLMNMNKELESFAYISSHDLQEPLRKIQTFSERIFEQDYEQLSQRGKDYFERMQSAAKRMQKLIEDLLEYARTSINDAKFDEVKLVDVVNEVKHEMKEQIEQSSALVTVEEDCVLQIIHFQFRQLLQNLFSNALKFSKPGESPRITISCSSKKGNEVDRSLLSNVDYYVISVADNGIGFEQEFSTKIFELFQRLHGKHEYKGTGIGLAICKKIAENHQGIIRAEGSPGVGATFHICIPSKHY